MAQSKQNRSEVSGGSSGTLRPNGSVIIGELIRNMELGRFEMAYTVLLPCVFTVFLNPQDFAVLRGVLPIFVEDARKALRARVNELNVSAAPFGMRKNKGSAKECKIAAGEWQIEILPDPEVPPGDVEIHSELSEASPPGYRGTKTTLLGRDSASERTAELPASAHRGNSVYATIQYEDDSGSQIYEITQNQVRVGRGGDEQPVDLMLIASDEISREHVLIRRDPASGVFTISDTSTNGTWVNGKRLRKGAQDVLPSRAKINLSEILTLVFEGRA